MVSIFDRVLNFVESDEILALIIFVSSFIIPFGSEFESTLGPYPLILFKCCCSTGLYLVIDYLTFLRFFEKIKPFFALVLIFASLIFLSKQN